MLRCGGDEAGRGAVLGPLVISMVAVKDSSVHKLSEIGVRDSKLLSDKKRRSLFNDIEDIASEIKVDRIYPEDINEAMRSHISLNELEAVRFAGLFDKMDKSIGSVYLDSPDVIPERFGTRFKIASIRPTKVVGVKSPKESGASARVIAEHKADSRYAIVSAASIIAKVVRDKEMAKIERSLGLKLGSGYPSDYNTIEAIKANLKSGALDSHIRQKWITIDRIRQTQLTSF